MTQMGDGLGDGDESFGTHTVTQPFSDFSHVQKVPLVQGIYIDPIRLGFEIGMLLSVRLPEIWAPGTPRVSLGTKIFYSKFFSYNNSKMLFYGFGRFILHKFAKNMKNWPILVHYVIIEKNAKFG